MEECYFKPVTLLKVTLLHRGFSCFLNSKNGLKSRKTLHMILCFRNNDVLSPRKVTFYT